MIKIDKVKVMNIDAAIRGMRNPLNSWDKSDSDFTYESWHDMSEGTFEIGSKDMALMKNLAEAGSDHRKYMRMMIISMDILAPLYWWKEFDTYKVGTVANSCSTMHTIHRKEFTIEDFSCERLSDIWMFFPDNTDIAPIVEADVMTDTQCHYLYGPKDILNLTIDMLNVCRELYIRLGNKEYWNDIIQLLPSSYNQLRTVALNYEVLRNMYHSRMHHKLDEWVNFCAWIETLPYSELITGKDSENFRVSDL